MMNIFEINKRIGQRPPFQMIEKVLELEPNVSAYVLGIGVALIDNTSGLIPLLLKMFL